MKNLRNVMSVITMALVMLVSGNVCGQENISLEDAIRIGELHNEYLSKINFKDIKNIKSLNEAFINIKPNDVSVEFQEDIQNYFQNNSLEDREKDILSQLSKEGQVVFNECKALVLGVKNYSETVKQLDNKRLSIEKFNSKDKSLIYTFIETSKKSLSFWLPKKMGGQEKYSMEGVERVEGQSVNWGAIAYSDGTGAASTLTRAWVLAVNPLTWGAILGAIGWGAAWSSGSALLYQLM